MTFDIDLLIVVGFLVATLIVGVRKNSAVSNIKDFAVGNRNFPTGAIVTTLVATWISGSFLFGSLEEMYTEGITIIVAYLMFPSMFLIMNYFFIPKMQEFFGNLSVADSMGKLYGEKVAKITAITGAISCLGMVAVQFKIFGTLFEYFFAFGSTYNLILSSAIVIFYSSFGGIKSVTITDILQFLIFSIFIPTILFLMIQDVELSHVYNTIANTHFLDFNRHLSEIIL